MHWAPWHDTRPHVRFPPSLLGMDDLITERSFDSQASLVIRVLSLFFTLFSDVYQTKYWLWSGRLVQELNVCTIKTHLITDFILRACDLGLKCKSPTEDCKREHEAVTHHSTQWLCLQSMYWTLLREHY